MKSEVLYMLGIVSVGFLLNFGLRAVPFVIFGFRRHALPKGVEAFGTFVSPVIIAALIVYSYWGLAWRTPWPYLAGGLTIALQLVFRKPLVSIIAGTVVYMCVLNCGCTSQRIVQLDKSDPSIHYSDYGITMNGASINPVEVVKVLRDNDIPTDRVIHIRMEEGTRDLRGARTLMGILAKGGYTRPVLVSDRKSEAFNTGRPKKAPPPAAAQGPRKIRYKKASE